MVTASRQVSGLESGSGPRCRPPRPAGRHVFGRLRIGVFVPTVGTRWDRTHSVRGLARDRGKSSILFTSVFHNEDYGNMSCSEVSSCWGCSFV